VNPKEISLLHSGGPESVSTVQQFNYMAPSSAQLSSGSHQQSSTLLSPGPTISILWSLQLCSHGWEGLADLVTSARYDRG